MVVTAQNSVAMGVAASPETAIITGPAGTPLSINATVSGPSTVAFTQSTTCATIHLSDGATGNPVQASEVDLAISGFASSGSVNGTTDANGNGSLCYPSTAPGAHQLQVTFVEAGGLGYLIGATTRPLSSNTLDQTWDALPAGGVNLAPGRGRGYHDGDHHDPGRDSHPDGDHRCLDAHDNPDSKGAGRGARLAKLTAALISGKRPHLSVTANVSKAATVTLTLLDRKRHKLTSWKERATSGINRFVLLLPPRARARARHAASRCCRLDQGDDSARRPRPLVVWLAVVVVECLDARDHADAAEVDLL